MLCVEKIENGFIIAQTALLCFKKIRYFNVLLKKENSKKRFFCVKMKTLLSENSLF